MQKKKEKSTIYGHSLKQSLSNLSDCSIKKQKFRINTETMSLGLEFT